MILNTSFLLQINWLRFLKLITDKKNLNEASHVYVVRPEYFKVLDTVLGKETNR
jgi:hypothetical protein